MLSDDHPLVGTVSVPIHTDPFAVHAVSEERRVGRQDFTCSVTIYNDVCVRP
jgi:hypothetical protein